MYLGVSNWLSGTPIPKRWSRDARSWIRALLPKLRCHDSRSLGRGCSNRRLRCVVSHAMVRQERIVSSRRHIEGQHIQHWLWLSPPVRQDVLDLFCIPDFKTKMCCLGTKNTSRKILAVIKEMTQVLRTHVARREVFAFLDGDWNGDGGGGHGASKWEANKVKPFGGMTLQQEEKTPQWEICITRISHISPKKK